MKTCFILLMSFLLCQAKAQTYLNLESVIEPELAPGKSHTQKLFGDSLVSSFLLYATKEVVLHKHNDHSEHVYVLDGEADMRLGEKTLRIKKGDLIFIPKGTPHSAKVVSEVPLKVISIQAPLFDGKDRVILK